MPTSKTLTRLEISKLGIPGESPLEIQRTLDLIEDGDFQRGKVQRKIYEELCLKERKPQFLWKNLRERLLAIYICLRIICAMGRSKVRRYNCDTVKPVLGRVYWIYRNAAYRRREISSCLAGWEFHERHDPFKTGNGLKIFQGEQLLNWKGKPADKKNSYLKTSKKENKEFLYEFLRRPILGQTT